MNTETRGRHDVSRCTAPGERTSVRTTADALNSHTPTNAQSQRPKKQQRFQPTSPFAARERRRHWGHYIKSNNWDRTLDCSSQHRATLLPQPMAPPPRSGPACVLRAARAPPRARRVSTRTSAERAGAACGTAAPVVTPMAPPGARTPTWPRGVTQSHFRLTGCARDRHRYHHRRCRCLARQGFQRRPTRTWGAGTDGSTTINQRERMNEGKTVL